MKKVDILYRKDDRSVAKRVATFNLEVFCPTAILVAFFLFLCSWHRIYFLNEYIAGWDLPGQVAAVERMMLQLPHFRISSYDPAWFGGWGLGLFYAPLFHVLTALLAYPLALVSQYPAQFACHIGLALGCAALPFSMWYFVLPFARSMKKGQELSVSEISILALAVCFLSFWFLNNDNENSSVGYGVVMGIGLYTQLWGWHMMFLHGGALCRWLETKKRRYQILTVLFYAALFLTHSLTAVFVLGVVFMLTLWYQQEAAKIFRAHILAIGLTGFWMIPALVFSKTYAVASTIKGNGDMLEIMIRYPVHLLIQHVKSCLIGKGSSIDLGFLLVAIFFVLFFLLKKIRQAQIAVVFWLVILLAFIFTNSAFLARCFEFSIHYYRFLGDEVLYATALLALVPYALLINFSGRSWEKPRHITAAVIAFVLLAGIYSTACFPQLERQKIIDLLGKTPEHQDEVLGYFKRLPDKGRVYFEFFDDDSKYGSWAAHYLEARLFRETGFESANGLFIESSNAYRLIGATASNLGAHAWAAPNLFGNEQNKSVEQALRQLKEFGITHVVCSDGSAMFEKLKSHCIGDIVKYGPYAICQIAELPSWKISKIDKVILGYVDKAGNLPFEYLQFYFYTRDALSSKYDLIDFTKRKLIPDIPVVLVNTGDSFNAALPPNSVSDSNPSPKILPVNYKRYDTIDHYHVWYQDSPELDTFGTIVQNLDESKLTEKLESLTSKLPRPKVTGAGQANPKMSWSADFQSMHLSNLEPGVLVKLDYSYLPFWHPAPFSHSDDTRIFKGTNEQIYVLPMSAQVDLAYDQWISPYFWLGLFVSFASSCIVFIQSRCYASRLIIEKLAWFRRR